MVYVEDIVQSDRKIFISFMHPSVVNNASALNFHRLILFDKVWVRNFDLRCPLPDLHSLNRGCIKFVPEEIATALRLYNDWRKTRNKKNEITVFLGFRNLRY